MSTTFVRRALCTALVTGGLVVAGIAGAAAASAAEGDVVDLTVGTDTSIDLNLGDVAAGLPDVSVQTPVDLPPVSTEPVEAAVQAVAGDGGVVDSVVGADAPTATTTDDVVPAVVEDATRTLDAVAAADVPAVVQSVTGQDALVDDAIEDGAIDAVAQRVTSLAATADDGLIDDVLEDPAGTSGPGTTDPGVGTTDPTDPGTTDPGTTDPGTTDPGTGTTDPGTTPGSGLGGARPSAGAGVTVHLPADLVALVDGLRAAGAANLTGYVPVSTTLAETGSDDTGLLVVALLLLGVGTVTTRARLRWERRAVEAARSV